MVQIIWTLALRSKNVQFSQRGERFFTNVWEVQGSRLDIYRTFATTSGTSTSWPLASVHEIEKEMVDSDGGNVTLPMVVMRSIKERGILSCNFLRGKNSAYKRLFPNESMVICKTFSSQSKCKPWHVVLVTLRSWNKGKGKWRRESDHGKGKVTKGCHVRDKCSWQIQNTCRSNTTSTTNLREGIHMLKMISFLPQVLAGAEIQPEMFPGTCSDNPSQIYPTKSRPKDPTGSLPPAAVTHNLLHSVHKWNTKLEIMLVLSNSQRSNCNIIWEEKSLYRVLKRFDRLCKRKQGDRQVEVGMLMLCERFALN